MKSEVLAVRQEEYLIKSVEEIDMVEFLPITAERLVDIREKTERDESLQQKRRSSSRNQKLLSLQRGTHHSRWYSVQMKSGNRTRSVKAIHGEEN